MGAVCGVCGVMGLLERRSFEPLVSGGASLFDLSRLQLRRRTANEAEIRALCANAYLGAQTAVCRVLGRYKLFVDTFDVGLSTHLLLDGYWEMWLTEALAEAVRPGMTVVDVGANLGYFTLLMADLVGPGGHVCAFEPNRPIAERLRKSVDVNGFADRVRICEDALADQDGVPAVLVVPASEPKNAHVVGCATPLDASAPGLLPITTRRFDSFPELLDATVIKIDADTSEEAIWRGLRGRLLRPGPLTIFLEFAPARYADPCAFLTEILAAGFDLRLLTLEAGIRRVSRGEVLAGSPVADRQLVLVR
jgi:FkbM family methyltransferase